MDQYPQALTIAGIDCDGGGGMPIDLKTMQLLKVYCHSVIIENVATNSQGIVAEQPLPLTFIDQQFAALASDYQIKACKTGLLSNRQLIERVIDNYNRYDFGPLILDPVCLAKTGESLLSKDAFVTLRDKLLPLATVITPNYGEAELLTGMKLDSPDKMKSAAHELQNLGVKNVIIKGKHNENGVNDLVLLENGECFELNGKYYKTKRKNGTGDALSAAITAELSKGTSVKAAIITAKKLVQRSISNPILVGNGFGPINLF